MYTTVDVCVALCVYLGFSYQYCYCCCCCKLWNMEFLMDLPMKMHSLLLDTFVAVIIAVFLCCWLYIVVVVVVAVIGVVVLKSRTKNKTYQQRFDSILSGGERTYPSTDILQPLQPTTDQIQMISLCLSQCICVRVYVYVCQDECLCMYMCVFVYAFVVVRVVFLVMCQHKGLQILRRRTNWLVGWLDGWLPG